MLQTLHLAVALIFPSLSISSIHPSIHSFIHPFIAIFTSLVADFCFGFGFFRSVVIVVLVFVTE